jgi:hypothetical protein
MWAADAERFDAHNAKPQGTLAARSSSGVRVVVEQCGHTIQANQSGQVVDAIRDVEAATSRRLWIS